MCKVVDNMALSMALVEVSLMMAPGSSVKTFQISSAQHLRMVTLSTQSDVKYNYMYHMKLFITASTISCLHMEVSGINILKLQLVGMTG